MRAIRKMFTFSCHALLVCVAVSAVVHNPWSGQGHPTLAGGSLFIGAKALMLSSILLVMVFSQFVHILRSYGNIFTRLMAAEAFFLGLPLSALTITLGLTGGQPVIAIAGGAQLVAWIVFGARYQANKGRYEKQGCGPVPVDTCIRIPAELPRPGDAIGTGGQMAKLLRQGVAHTETVIMWEGRPMLFSSWFENGAFLNEVSRILKPDPKYPNYWLQRRPALRPDQVELTEYVVRAMMRQNQEYVCKLKASRARMPAFLRNFLDKKFPATGYDWVGRYTGRRAPDRWTCNVVYLEVMRRCGVDVVSLGQGAAGLRTGWFDIPNTEDLRGDKALHLVRNVEIPGLLAGVQPSSSANSSLSSSLESEAAAQAAFDAEVESLIASSTNIFAARRKG